MKALRVTGLLVLGLIVGCTTTVPTPTSPPDAPAPTLLVFVTPEPMLAQSPGPPAALVCQGVDPDCDKAIELVRAVNPADLAAADTIVIADVCPPDVLCDRLWAFDSFVVLIQAGSVLAAYEVTGVSGPEAVRPVAGPLPPHIVALVRGAEGTVVWTFDFQIT